MIPSLPSISRSCGRAALAVAGGLSLTSCFAVTNLDRFAQNSATYVDLTFTVRGMKSHVAELFEFRVVDESNIIQARGIALPLGGVDATFVAPRAIPAGKKVRIDFFADHNGSKGYDATATDATDHAWRIPVDLAGVGSNGVVLTFEHNTLFQYLDDGGPSREVGKPGILRFTGMGSRKGKRLQVRFADAFTRRLVALFRYPNLDKEAGELVVPGMIEAGNPYSVEVTVDDEAAGLGSLEAWRLQEDSNDQGLDVTFDPAAADRFKVTDAPRP
jgi:hypothetical protein